MKRRFLIAGLAVLAWAGPAGAQSPHPFSPDTVINFQGRVEVGDVGYSTDGVAYFQVQIGSQDMDTVYWGPETVEVPCVEGVFNILLGADTDPLPASVFDNLTHLYLRVAFSDGVHGYETLSPDQRIVSVPFAVNADLLDGQESPDSAIVGISDTQTLTDKTLSIPVIGDWMKFTPQADAPDPAETGMLYASSAASALRYYYGEGWADLPSSDFGEVMAVAGLASGYEAGDVVAQSLKDPNRVEKASGAYADTVVGVVSDRASVKLDYSAPANRDKVVVGMMGLVKCKVSGENGPIKPGDKLVSSSTPGYAMKADLNVLRFWQSVGTAREYFYGDFGTIEIWVGR